MSNSIVSKLKNFVGISNYVGEEDDIFEELYRSDSEYLTTENMTMETDTQRRNKNNLKVVNHPNSLGHEVMIIEPRSFDESLELIAYLRERKSIVINLHLLDAEQSQRVVDFLSGATHAIDGHQQRVGDGVFVFTPSNVPISAESEKSKAIRDAFWNHPQ